MVIKNEKWPVNLVKIEKKDLDLFEEHFLILKMQIEYEEGDSEEEKAKKAKKQENPKVLMKDGKFLYFGACRDGDLRYFIFDRKALDPSVFKRIKKECQSLQEIIIDDVPDLILLKLFLNSLQAKNKSGLEEPMFFLYSDKGKKIGVKIETLSTPDFRSNYAILRPVACRIDSYLDAQNEWKNQIKELEKENKKDNLEKIKYLKHKLGRPPMWMNKGVHPIRLVAVGEKLKNAYVHYQNRYTGHAFCDYFTMTVHSTDRIKCESILMDYCLREINEKYKDYISVELAEMNCCFIRKMTGVDYSKFVEKRINKLLPEVDLFDSTNDPEAVKKLVDMINKIYTGKESDTGVHLVNEIDDSHPTLVIVPEEHSKNDGHAESKIHRKHLFVRISPKDKNNPNCLIDDGDLRVKARQALSGLINNRAAEDCDLNLLFSKPEILKKYTGWTFLMYDRIEKTEKAYVYSLRILENGKVEYLPIEISPYSVKDKISFECILPNEERYRVQATELRPMPKVENIRNLLDSVKKAQDFDYKAGDLYSIYRDSGIPDEENMFFGKDPDTIYYHSEFAGKLGRKQKVRDNLNEFYQSEEIMPGTTSFKGRDIIDSCSADLYDVCIWSENLNGSSRKQWYISSGVASGGQSGNQGTPNAPVLYRVSRIDKGEVGCEILEDMAELMDSKVIRSIGDPVKPAPFKLIQLAKRYGLFKEEE